MPPAERDRLSHMLEAARDAASFATDRTRSDLDHDRMLRHALFNCIQIIGEASSHVSPATRMQLDTIPWRQIRGMRNFLVHAYHGVNLDALWRTVTTDIPVLIEALAAYLGTDAELGI